MNKSEKFSNNLQEMARFARAISHPARLAILQYLAETKTCITGDISDNLPLSRTTVSQHLKELRDLGLIQGNIDGLKINYCLCNQVIESYLGMLNAFFEPVSWSDATCVNYSKKERNKTLTS
jgi:DNA-binding transcriptional ArsR family regulator